MLTLSNLLSSTGKSNSTTPYLLSTRVSMVTLAYPSGNGRLLLQEPWEHPSKVIPQALPETFHSLRLLLHGLVNRQPVKDYATRSLLEHSSSHGSCMCPNVRGRQPPMEHCRSHMCSRGALWFPVLESAHRSPYLVRKHLW
jgi:hypothetical protein